MTRAITIIACLTLALFGQGLAKGDHTRFIQEITR